MSPVLWTRPTLPFIDARPRTAPWARVRCAVVAVAGRVLSPADLLPQHTHGDQHVEPPDVHLLAHTDLDLPRTSPQF